MWGSLKANPDDDGDVDDHDIQSAETQAAARSLVEQQNNTDSYWNDWKQTYDQVLGGLYLFVWHWFL